MDRLKSEQGQLFYQICLPPTSLYVSTTVFISA